MSATRRGGTARVNTDALDRQLALKGISAAQLAERAGLHETAISRARHHRVQYQTLRRIATALLSFPDVEGVEELVAQPERAPELEAATA